MRRSALRSSEALEARTSALGWVATLLWGQGAVVQPGREPSRDPARSFYVLPGLGRPRLLIPAGSRSAAGASLRQFNDSMTQTARFRKVAASSLFAFGLGSRVAHDRIWISLPQDSQEGGGIEALLAEVFGRTDLQISVAFGPTLRPNVKPILQVLTNSGDVLGYVKVGWNDLTRRLVENEARGLGEWHRRPPATFRVPRLLYRGTWNNLAVTVVSPVENHVVRRVRRNALPPIEVIREIAEQTGDARSADAYVEDLRDRVMASSLDDPDRGRVVRLLDRSEKRLGNGAVPIGTWHGDFGPWNMSRSGRGLFIWDWERCSGVVPIGSDVLHFGFQVRYAVQGSSVATAAREALSRGRVTLETLGVPEHLQRDVLTAYLIERILRVEEGRANGVLVRSGLTGEILDHLETAEGTG